jgi:hypothetical protein
MVTNIKGVQESGELYHENGASCTPVLHFLQVQLQMHTLQEHEQKQTPLAAFTCCSVLQLTLPYNA